MSLPPFTFSPFTCRLRDLDVPDLKVLREAEEGWYLDYKRDVPTVDSAAKSISSFANTYGGWLIYGVDAPGGGAPSPSGFPGIGIADVSRTQEVLQRAAATLVNPAPFFEIKTIVGPAVDIGLPANRTVIVVRVPPGAHAPYVHGNGRIYRRVADSSEPKHETDRSVLDLLWERSRRALSRWTELIEDEPLLSKREEDTPTAHVFFSHDPFGDRGSRLGLSFHEFVDVMRAATGGLPFDNFYPDARGYVARQTVGSDPYNLVLTWRQQVDATAVLSFPIPWTRIDDNGLWALGTLSGYKFIEEFAEQCRERGPKAGRVIDLNFVPLILHGALHRYRALLDASGYDDDFFVKVRINDTWRTIPFIDLKTFVDDVGRLGVPVVQDSHFFAPSGADTLIPLGRRPRPLEEDGLLADTMKVTAEVAAGLGVHLPIPDLVSDLWGLLSRAQQVQRSTAAQSGRQL